MIFYFSKKIILSSKMNMLTLFEHLKPIKTDRSWVVVSDSLDITSGSRLKWPFMPKQGPRCLINDPILIKPIWNDRSLIVDSDGLDLTSVSRPGWSFMPEQGPKSKVQGPEGGRRDPEGFAIVTHRRTNPWFSCWQRKPCEALFQSHNHGTYRW